MTTSTSTNQSYVQTELFRPSLNYPVHSYDEMLTRTAERYPEHVAVVFREVSLTYRELEALVNAFANALQEHWRPMLLSYFTILPEVMLFSLAQPSRPAFFLDKLFCFLAIKRP